ncbi:MAG: hypothetical protein Q8R92_19830, partial [Deltaproteobacteria bacterium]|nr:hypothetical protein [Deltaproteobacteria bacterium]
MSFDLPDEVAALLQEHEEKGAQRLAALTLALVTKRQEAINDRKASGIEDIWMRAEEAYLGIDDTNRGTFAKARWSKPTTMNAPLTSGAVLDEVGDIRSDAFVRLTSRYVDAGAAKLGEILLPADEKAFSFTNTPVPDLVRALKDNSQAVVNGVPLERDAPPPAQGMPGMPPPAAQAQPGAPAPGVPLTVKDLAQEALDFAGEAAKKAEKRISDWMVQSRYRAE